VRKGLNEALALIEKGRLDLPARAGRHRWRTTCRDSAWTALRTSLGLPDAGRQALP